MSHSWVLKRGMNIIKQFLTRHIFFKLFSLNCFWRVRNIYVPSWFSSSETVCFWASEIFKFIQLACDASENYQIYFLQTALSSNCFWCQNYLLYQKQFVSERQKFVQIYVLQTASEASEIFLLYFFVNLFLSNLFSYFWRAGIFFFNLFLRQTSLVVVNLHSLCKNMSFQTQILFRSVYEWSEFYFFSKRL